MRVQCDGNIINITKKSINAVSPSVLKKRREAFERKKKTAAFKRWRIHQYKVTQRGRCSYCNKPIKGVWVTDHIIPLFRGGTSNYKNLTITCWNCNQKKGIKLI